MKRKREEREGGGGGGGEFVYQSMFQGELDQRDLPP